MVLRMTKSGPGRNPSFLKCILRFRGPKQKEKHSPVVRKQLLKLPAQSALLSAFMVIKAFRKLGFGLGPDLTMIGSINLNMMLKIEFKKIKIAYGLVKTSRNIIFTFLLLFYQSIEKSLWRLYRSPVIVAGELPSLVILSELGTRTWRIGI